VDSFSRLVRGRTRRALLLVLPIAAAVAAMLGALTVGVTGGEAGVVVGAAAGLWIWLGSVRTRVEESHRLALTDDLTGLGNRRRLLGDLERAIGEGTDHSPSALAMFDLDGFKAYNDTHGHPAGDALLAHLGARLGATFAASGAAYRLGGDEFCVLVHGSTAELEGELASAIAALTEEEADVRPSYGFALLPREARDPSSALRIVDQRMYAQKDGRRASTKLQARDILLAVLDQHAPDLRAHSDWVSDLARSVSQRLGLARDKVEEVALAADLHDVGKAVVPRSILEKPGPLDKSEWEIMRRHTAVGEAILASAPALRGVAALVRATHERIDGTGYPDGLAGDDIPLGARIVAVCDAFDAMTSDRAYRPAMSREDALAELDAGAGTQFDPAVVAAARSALEHPSTRLRSPDTAPRPAPDLSPVARIQGLVDVIRLVRIRDEPDRLLDEIAVTVGSALGLGTVVINLYRPEWDDFVVCSVHGNDEAREALLGSTYPREWFDPIMDSRFLRRGTYVIEQGTFDWGAHLGDRYVPSAPDRAIPGAWQPEDELFVPFRHSDGHILGIFSVGDPASGLRLSEEELDVLVAAASQAGVLVEASQSAANWARSQTALTELLAVSSRLIESGSVDDVLSVVCNGIRSALGFDKVVIQLRDPATGNFPSVAGIGWDAGDPALETPTTAEDLDRLLDPEFEIEGCFLLPYEEGAARCSAASVSYSSQLNGSGPNAWNRHWLLVPLRETDGSLVGVVWADDPRDRLLPIPRRLQALRLFANQTTSALATARMLETLSRLERREPPRTGTGPTSASARNLAA
jgi:diguanylate cyclase (GGDEF)-like protein